MIIVRQCGCWNVKKGKSTSWIDLVMYTSEIEPSDAGLDDYDDPDEIPLPLPLE